MKNFLKGAFFVSVFLPVTEGLMGILNQFMELLAAKLAVQAYKLQKTITDEANPAEENVVGFQMPVIDTEEAEDDE